jgi:hypothetical protein
MHLCSNVKRNRNTGTLMPQMTPKNTSNICTTVITSKFTFYEKACYAESGDLFISV